MVNEFFAIKDLEDDMFLILHEIEDVSKEHEAETKKVGMTFFHMLFDNFCLKHRLNIKEQYEIFANDGKAVNDIANSLRDILSNKRS